MDKAGPPNIGYGLKCSRKYISTEFLCYFTLHKAEYSTKTTAERQVFSSDIWLFVVELLVETTL